MENIKQRLLQILESSQWNDNDKKWMSEYLESSDTSALQKIMQEEFKKDLNTNADLTDKQAQKLLQKIHQRIKAGINTGRLVHLSLWKRIAAAAAILLLLGSASYFLFFNNGKKEIAKTDYKTPLKIDIPPGGNKAVLTLGDNRTIILDNAHDGTLAQQGNTKVLKLKDGQLAYNASGNSKDVLYNTISTPRGGQYQMTLSDGSKVWLNAASSIRFPVAFTGNERKVEITGEAYFEVSKNPAKPFKVEVNGKQEVEVLGTHFNINSYADEATINTTLLEGKVKVTPLNNLQPVTGNQQFLSPGQQAQLTSNGQISLNKNPDIEQVMAWKNGIFNFENADLNMVLRQLSRWYDVNVIFKGTIPQRIFEGEMQRSLNLSQVLRILEKNNVHFRIEGKNLVVLK
ncbi:MAG: FecR domain-containing protein [Bacteroidetes bacterium]|nr:FecR domain-containing protein [Bacteroidota bacterium]MBS1929648.1 FecR domain-containing protein [Bacteroidota bacterium]